MWSSFIITKLSAEQGIMEEALETIDLLWRLLSVLNKWMFVLGVTPDLLKFIGVSHSL